mgnify:CR=1 FL=1
MDTTPLAQFLTQRQLEIEQARVEAMQAALLEKQRLRRESAYYVARHNARAALAANKQGKYRAFHIAMMRREGISWLSSTHKSIEEIATTILRDLRPDRLMY